MNTALVHRNLKVKTNIFLCMLFIVTVVGCRKEWLEIKVDKTQAVPETVKDFQAMLDYSIGSGGVNRTSACPILNEIAADGHYYDEKTFNSWSSSTAYYKNAYLWAELSPYTGLSTYLTFYSVPYSTILDLNIILDGVRRSIDSDKSSLLHIRSQALFHRAYNFYDLSQSFCSQFDPFGMNEKPGIALRLSTDITAPSKRSSVKETYEQIISDLLDSKDGLPVIPKFVTRASKPAALGMLAKVYLTMGDYDNAIRYANEYLVLKNELLDYNTISTSVNFIGINKEVAFARFLGGGSYTTSSYLIEKALFDNYDENDLRKKIFFNVGVAGITFKGSYSNRTSDTFAGIATDEIYLIRAECYARKNNLALAMSDLNKLLRTRYSKNADGTSKYVDQTAIDENDALKKILNERKKQLILRSVRWTDLRRLNKDDRFKTNLTRTINGTTYTLAPNSFKYTFPIPNEVIQLSDLNQNEGW